jgi:hypothetical protein
VSRPTLDTAVAGAKPAPAISDAEAEAVIAEMAARRPNLFDRGGELGPTPSTADALAAGARAAAASATDILAAETRLDRCLAALDSDDATLADVRNVLHVLGRSLTPVDPVRLMGVCMRLSGVLGRYSADVLGAPPAALNDVVRDSLVGCRNDLCGAKVAPWSDAHNGCCDGPCQTAWLRTVES